MGCGASFDTTIYAPELKPASIPPSLGCCSSNHYSCSSSLPRFFDECIAANAAAVWLPNGTITGTCTKANTKCNATSECCGSLVCEVSSSEYSKECREATSMCVKFNNEPWCGSISACKWDGINNKCIPSFDTSIYEPEKKPVSKPLDPGCCSSDHVKCNKRSLVTPALCTATEKENVWLPNGAGPGANKAECVARRQGGDCTKNEDCCGSLVCAPTPDNPLLSCLHPTKVCYRFTKKGAALCNQVPGCKFELGKCVPSFDASIYNATVKAALKTPVVIKTVAQGNADFLGLCKGYVGSLSGDPHFTSFDRRKFDCQGTGAFVLVKAPGMLEIQGIFERAGPKTASVTKGIAIDYPALADVPRIQVSLAPYADTESPTTYMLSNSCASHVYLDGAKQVAVRGGHIANDGSYAMIFNDDGGVDIQFFDTTTEPPTPVTAVRIRVGGSPTSTFGCVMSIQTCLAGTDTVLRNKTIGLLGTPNSNPNDDWKTPNGQVLNITSKGSEAYDYCTTYHCVGKPADSLFTYDPQGKTFKDLYSCASEFPGEPDVLDAPENIAVICGEDAECLMDGILGDVEDAVRNLEEKELIAEIITSPVLTPEVAFNLPDPNVTVDCQYPKPGVNQCPADVVLLNTPATFMPVFVQSPITILEQKGTNVTFNISNPFPDNITAMYYQYNDGSKWSCLEQKALPSCFKPLTMTATCISGRNATHASTRKFALVDIWFVDAETFGPADNVTVPECCQPDPAHSKTNTALYTYKVYCDDSCPIESTTRRHLRLRK